MRTNINRCISFGIALLLIFAVTHGSTAWHNRDFQRNRWVGDTLTVGETGGTVSRIRIRATTITDWDRRELIVPNKEFISLPQRDVHLDASSPLEVRVVSGINRE